MGIYTKKGDTGTTSLASGRRVVKHDARVETYGTVDELQAAIGLARSFCGREEMNRELFEIENKLIPIMGELSMGAAVTVSAVTAADVARLEALIDTYDGKLPPLTNFEIPGRTQCDSAMHLARTVCRRVERRLCALAEAEPVSSDLLAWINRLSDLLFTFARSL
ncbi:MAG: cob(I)yrinic acid a,c-diamide adenosyltransferase [Clostridiales Family XIII bacterium]|jgi:cob(I)alamin adenosyltransferase|nr:cob(I)yrinic acid a,c-diamide adenosyltransferase [Clostridiales Family XIII bacterium]